jgi:FtsH-binding integral membrane protein
MSSRQEISIWFFIGVCLLVIGVLILGAGIYELVRPPEVRVVLYQLHANIWWGAILAAVGGLYCLKFRPGRESKEQKGRAQAV